MIIQVCVQDICTQKIKSTGEGVGRARAESGEVISREQMWELEENKRSLLKQAYRMKQECPHMSPVGLEYEMYAAIMAEVQEITARLQRSAEA